MVICWSVSGHSLVQNWAVAGTLVVIWRKGRFWVVRAWEKWRVLLRFKDMGTNLRYEHGIGVLDKQML